MTDLKAEQTTTFAEWYENGLKIYSGGLGQHYRLGQHLFNYLSAYDSALARMVPHHADPFYNDELIPAFLDWVSYHWNRDEINQFYLYG